MAEPQAPHELFPSNDFREVTDDWLTRQLCKTRDLVRAGPVTTAPPIDSFNAELADLDFETPQEVTDVLDWVLSRLGPGMVHVTHPRYFGLFNPTPTYAAECADRIVACLNPQLASARTSPFPVALEASLIKKLASRAGLPPDAGGHFTTSGSEANYTAALCALTSANPLFASDGAIAFSGRPTIYISANAHLAWLKIAHQSGIGRNAIRLIATDKSGRLDAQALITCIRADLASGCIPVMIVATAGTTVAGMVDPLRECHEIANRYRTWFHVDAAWGGALICSDRYSHLLQGIEYADSITMDAHKWFATTMCCGIFLTSKQGILSDTFHATMDCMPSNFADIDPWVTTVQWSRRFLGLRLFVSLACVGWQGHAAHVEKAISLAGILKACLEVKGWKQLNDSSLAVLCLRPPAGAPDPRHIAKSLVQEGEAWISTAEFEGEWVIRACITSGETTEADILRLAGLLQKHSTNP